ncbi:MAG: ElyC/SanA/YdcF family protein [Patescibacteria group bacterium]|nr:ElyC/SanA/YdcF family protein [Patescibacteria group bacterium]
MKTFLKIVILLTVVAMLAAGGLAYSVRTEYSYKIYDSIESLPENSVMVVLGASVKRDKTPSDALEDRLETAVRAWRAQKTEKIILSGDDGRWAQPEIQAMVLYMYDNGVPDEMLLVDGNNARTFDSCYRLKNELGQNKVVLVTQNFHLPRALYLCNKIGLDAWGISVDIRSYQKIAWFTMRDWMASLLAFWDIYMRKAPTYLQ